MLNLTAIRKPLAGVVLALVTALGMVSQAAAVDMADPAQVMDSYVDSLLNGDTAQLLVLMGDSMKRKNRHVVLSPDTYSEFLKTHYDGVQATVEDMAPSGNRMNATIRFDYPSSDSSVIVFVLGEEDGQWKVISEGDI